MAELMRGTDIPITLSNLPEGIEIKRLDFSQNDEIVITKLGSDFTIEGNTATGELTQEETLKLDQNKIVELQLAYKVNGKARRTYIKKCPASKILYEGEI